jgi:branched-chain amino acid transport system permease protein
MITRATKCVSTRETAMLLPVASITTSSVARRLCQNLQAPSGSYRPGRHVEERHLPRSPMVANGFTLIFGLLRIVNLAHGTLYLLGGYVGFTVAVWRAAASSLGGAAAVVAVAVAGFVLSEGAAALRAGARAATGAAHVRRRVRPQRYGDTFTSQFPRRSRHRAGVRRLLSEILAVRPPDRLPSSSSCCGFSCTAPRIGALIRAGVDDAEMVEASGINIRAAFLVTFLIGSALAGIGGLLGGHFCRSIRRPTPRSWCSASPWW